jgi:hypothetical protein
VTPFQGKSTDVATTIASGICGAERRGRSTAATARNDITREIPTPRGRLTIKENLKKENMATKENEKMVKDLA